MLNPISRRERTKQTNEAKLLAAARHMFATVGLEGTSIQDIVTESGLSRGTFYNYLGSKEAAFAAVAADLLGEVGEAVGEARGDATDARSFVVEPFKAMVQVMSQDAETLRFVALNGSALRAVLAGPGPVESVESELQRDLDRAVTAGLLPAHRTDWMAAAMIGAALEVVTRVGPNDNVDDAGEFLAGLFLCALSGLDRQGTPGWNGDVLPV